MSRRCGKGRFGAAQYRCGANIDCRKARTQGRIGLSRGMAVASPARQKYLTYRTVSLRRRTLHPCATKRLMRRSILRVQIALPSPELLLYAQLERAYGDQASHQPIGNPELAQCLDYAVVPSLNALCI
jgi:hypothetical protein